MTDSRRPRGRELALLVMDEICDWLRANDIEPTTVPVDAVPKVADGQVTTVVFVFNEQGHRFVDPETSELAMSAVTVPLKVAPPDVLTEWLAGGSR